MQKSKKITLKDRAKKLLKLLGRPLFASGKKQLHEFYDLEKEKIQVYIKAVKEIMRETRLSQDPSIPGVEIDEEGNEYIYFYDFLQEWNNDQNGAIVGGAAFGVDGFISTVNVSGNGTILGLPQSIEKKEPTAVLKPIEVLHELQRVPNKIDLENLEEKILTFKMRKKFIRHNNYAKKEVMDMVVRLENRKQYEKFRHCFEKYDRTTTDAIEKLVKKYHLVLKTTDLFIPKFPKEAIDIMEDYEENCQKLCNKKPIFYVIAKAEDFKKEVKRNDPILLAQSPFGIYWDILGAWDKEILLLEEL